MPTRKDENERIALLQGTLDLLILRVLLLALAMARASREPSSANRRKSFLSITARSTWPCNGWKTAA